MYKIYLSVQWSRQEKLPMGWNPCNKYGCNINEEIIKQTADTLVSTGLAAAGYTYLNLDDCWQSTRDPITKKIIADPSGIPSLVQYVQMKSNNNYQNQISQKNNLILLYGQF